VFTTEVFIFTFADIGALLVVSLLCGRSTTRSQHATSLSFFIFKASYRL
jgi:hypothetical protein